MAIIQQITYGDAETRGKLRAWKKKLVERWTMFDRGYYELSRGKLRQLPIDMVLKGGVTGRRRAFEAIARALGPGATLASADLKTKQRSHAIWSILKPRDRVVLEGGPSFDQDCVTVNYVVAGYLPGPPEQAGVAEGLWTLEIPDHALGRAVERSRFLTPEAIILEAHRNLLKFPTDIAIQRAADGEKKSFLIKAGPGCFVGRLFAGSDISINGKVSAHVRVATWLSEDQLGNDQIPTTEPGETGKCLGDNILRPRPFVHFEEVGPGSIIAHGWNDAH
jgi:hypothetical protein